MPPIRLARRRGLTLTHPVSIRQLGALKAADRLLDRSGSKLLHAEAGATHAEAPSTAAISPVSVRGSISTAYSSYPDKRPSRSLHGIKQADELVRRKDGRRAAAEMDFRNRKAAPRRPGQEARHPRCIAATRYRSALSGG